MSRPRLRARRSRYGISSRLTRSAPALILAVLLIGVLLATSVVVARTVGFLRNVVNFRDPVSLLQREIEPPSGSVAWKLRHGQRVNLLLLGYGGEGNDAPYLTDSIMVVSLDPVGNRILEASIPRDLWVQIDAWQDGRVFEEKINVAFEIPLAKDSFGPGSLRPQYQGKDGAGRLAEATVTRVTGLALDKYVAVDFDAFRDVVDAIGGVPVHMETPLDDCHYPDYHNGYINGGVPPERPCPNRTAGIHFPAGDYTVNGERALQLARSRDAIQPEQATDFGRARRQQMILAAVRKKVTSGDVVTKAPRLMDALQKNFHTDMDLNDLKAVYDFSGKIPDNRYIKMAVTATDLVRDFPPYHRGTCGDPSAYVLCPIDPSYRLWRDVFARSFVDPRLVSERAPVQLVNASGTSSDMEQRLTNTLRPLGLQLADGSRQRYTAKTVIYDYSGGRYPATAAWVQDFFGAEVISVPPPSPAAVGGDLPSGLVVIMGQDFANRWVGR